MNARWRLAICLLVALLMVGAALAWVQWPLDGPQPDANERAPDEREAQIEALRAEIERELDRLRSAREQQDRTQAELRALEKSLEESRERIEELESEIGSTDGDY